jgi:uncharacterized protein (TIGR02145 family)
MRTQLSKIALAATLGFAITFTFSCSGGDDPDNGNGGGNATGGSNGSCNIGDYKTVTIGEQVWMAENLNCNVSGSKCYGDAPACTKYGRLYNWAAAKTVCPYGWHLPSDGEWTMLENSVGSGAGTKLKSTSSWDSNGNGTDDFGFSALPGGQGSYGIDFRGVGYRGYWWSSTETPNAVYAYYRNMNYDDAYVRRNYYDKSYLVSVRCVQD